MSPPSLCDAGRGAPTVSYGDDAETGIVKALDQRRFADDDRSDDRLPHPLIPGRHRG